MFGQTMRTAPSVIPNNITLFSTTRGDGFSVSSTNVTGFSTTADSTELQITVASGLTVGQAAVNRTASGTLTISAEL
jgi:hypothetical protein